MVSFSILKQTVRVVNTGLKTDKLFGIGSPDSLNSILFRTNANKAYRETLVTLKASATNLAVSTCPTAETRTFLWHV